MKSVRLDEGLEARLEEAARSRGRTPSQAFASVTRPLRYRGVAAGAARVSMNRVRDSMPETASASTLPVSLPS